MVFSINSQIMRTITLLITIFSLSFPAYAKYSGGTGEPNDPYQIATAEDLMQLGKTPEDYDKHFILTADIDLDPNLPGGKVFDRAVIAPDTDNSRGDFQGAVFGGIFDGNDHIISNLTIDTAGVAKDYLALFGEIRGKNPEVKNISVVNHKIISGDGYPEFHGGLVGRNFNGSISNCCAIGSITGGYSAENFGGLCGHNDFGTISGCYAAGSVTGSESDYLGGLCGQTFGNIINCYATTTVVGEGESWDLGGLCGDNTGTISNCYAKGSVISRNNDSVYLGGLCGENSGFISNCYAAGVVDVGNGSNYAGGLCGYYDPNGYISNCFWDIETSGQNTSDGGIGRTTAEMQTASTFLEAGWDFVGETENGTENIWKISEGLDYPRLWWQKYSGGTGEPNDPYQIATVEDLMLLGETPEDYDMHFILTIDIDLDPNLPGRKVFDRALIAPDTNDSIWMGFEGTPFSGVFDGNGKTITGLTIFGGDYLGLFGKLEAKAEVRDLALLDVSISGLNYVGSLAGFFRGQIITSYSTGTVSGNSMVGGLVGFLWIGTVSNSHSAALVSGTGRLNVNSMRGPLYGSVGGLIGENDQGSIMTSYSTGIVNGFDGIGGLAGMNSGSIVSCFSTGTVNSTEGEGAGGLVGFNNGNVTSSYSTCTVSGSQDVGGLVGSNHFDLGGDLGWAYGSISMSYSIGMVSGDRYVGGLVGFGLSDYVTSSFWDMQTSGLSTSDCGVGLTTAEMQTAQTFLEAGWDFVNETANGMDDIWWILEGQDYPHLWWEQIEQ